MLIYCDVDGTLTLKPHHPWGPPNEQMIDAIKRRIDSGDQVVIWSARGQRYVETFCAKYGIDAWMMLSKPDIAIDDKTGLDKLCKPRKQFTPEQFLQQG